MTIRTKTIEYAFASRSTQLATATSLASATFHDFTSTTIYIPETTNRTFKSVQIIFTARDAYTVVYNLAGARVKTTINSVASSNTDYAPTAITNTGEHVTWIWAHDCTADFVANFGTGTSQTVYPSIAISTATAANAQFHSARLIITYEYDDSASTQIKTVRIPIQSHHTTLTTSAVEVGTTGGTANASANQIPQLSTFLPENSVTIRQAFFEVWVNDTSGATTDLVPELTLDSTTSSPGTIECALNSGTMWHWIGIYDTATYATSSAHAFKWRDTTTTARYNCLGAVLTVTYEYNEANTTTVLNSVILGLSDEIDSQQASPGGTSSGDQGRYEKTYWVNEPGSITMAQSGLVIFYANSSGATPIVACGSQTARTYTLASLVNSGGSCIVHRSDHNSGWTSLSSGKNSLQFNIYDSTSNSTTQITGAYIILNYTSGKATKTGMHNHSTYWSLASAATSGAAPSILEIATTNQKTPVIPETNYFINDVNYLLFNQYSTSNTGAELLVEILSGEWLQDGWKLAGNFDGNGDSELGTLTVCYSATSLFNKYNQASGKCNIETARKYRVYGHQNTFHLQGLGVWVTYSTITYSVSGTISGSAGGTVNTALHDATTHEILATGSRSGNGTMDFTWYDTRTVYTTARESGTLLGRSDNGTPA